MGLSKTIFHRPPAGGYGIVVFSCGLDDSMSASYDICLKEHGGRWNVDADDACEATLTRWMMIT